MVNIYVAARRRRERTLSYLCQAQKNAKMPRRQGIFRFWRLAWRLGVLAFQSPPRGHSLRPTPSGRAVGLCQLPAQVAEIPLRGLQDLGLAALDRIFEVQGDGPGKAMLGEDRE